MAVQIISTRAASVDEWSQAFARCERATFFHGPRWSEVWEIHSHGRYRPRPQLVQFSDGQTAVLTITTERVGPCVERDHLSPAGTYGGWLTPSPLGPDHARLLSAEILRRPSVVWRRGPADLSDGVTSHGATSEATHVIDLRAGVGAARARWEGAARRQARKAERNGVRVRPGDVPGDWDLYFDLYLAAIRRWGTATAVYPQSLFTALSRVGPTAKLFLAESSGRVVAGAVLLLAHRHAGYWQGASGGAVAGASNLLHWEILDRLCSEGFKTYDLNPSGGLPGVIRFKESLGAVPMAAPIVIKPHPFEKVARRVERWRQRLGRWRPDA